jgi:hypothetical protein
MYREKPKCSVRRAENAMLDPTLADLYRETGTIKRVVSVGVL